MKLRVCFVIVSFLLATICTTLAQNVVSNSTPTSTQVPRLIKFSGVAKDESGQPVTGAVGITFLLYKDEQGGSPLWVETQNVRTDETGHYTAMLGLVSADGVPLSLFSSAEAHWISTQISGQREQPRMLLLSVPYALKAADAETLGGLPASAFMHAATAGAQGKSGAPPASPTAPNLPPAGVTGKGTKNFVPVWTGAATLGNSLIYETGGNIGIGTKTPKATVDVASNAALGMQVTVPGSAAAIDGIATDPKAGTTGVYGQSSSPIGNGVYGLDNATTGGIGVIGQSNATSGKSYGVAGLATSTSTGASGVLGNETATSGQVHGVSGFASSTTTGAVGVTGFELATSGQVYGVSGGTNSTTTGASGVNGFEGATAGKVSGVAGGTASNTAGASGVTGNASSTTGSVYGVNGSTPSTAGVGVIGTAYASSGNTAGIFGSTVSPNGIGAFGDSTSTTGGTGVQGQTESTSGGAAGIFVAHGGGGLLLSGLTGSTYVSKFTVDAAGNGFYAGNLNVTGKLTKGSGSFKIDHPRDPANKYLSHSFVESPDMMN